MKLSASLGPALAASMLWLAVLSPAAAQAQSAVASGKRLIDATPAAALLRSALSERGLDKVLGEHYRRDGGNGRR